MTMTKVLYIFFDGRNGHRYICYKYVVLYKRRTVFTLHHKCYQKRNSVKL